jgi:hypothetical protein
MVDEYCRCIGGNRLSPDAQINDDQACDLHSVDLSSNLLGPRILASSQNANARRSADAGPDAGKHRRCRQAIRVVVGEDEDWIGSEAIQSAGESLACPTLRLPQSPFENVMNG